MKAMVFWNVILTVVLTVVIIVGIIWNVALVATGIELAEWVENDFERTVKALVDKRMLEYLEALTGESMMEIPSLFRGE